jgi:Protein of unknown function (DUF3341)
MMVIAHFPHVRRMEAAARGASLRHYRVVDAYTPYPVEALDEMLDHRPGRIRVPMFIGGIAMAALAYGTEYYSAVVNYPYNSGGRPLDAWPAFMLVPFATGILIASIAGLIAFLVATGLPRLHHPLFAVEGFERASQDRFLLALAAPDNEDARRDMFGWLRETGATAIDEVDA